MKILHIISQKPAFTGSGTFYNALILECIKQGHSPYMIYSISAFDKEFHFEALKENTEIIEFDGSEINFPIPGMSDVMPYPSTKFSNLNDAELSLYFKIFRSKISKAIITFKPDIVWSHHLWIASSIVKELYPEIPVIAFCHGSDILQSTKSPIIFDKIRKNIEKIDVTISTAPEQSSEISTLLNLRKILYIGNGIREDIFYFKKNTYKKEKFIKLSYAGKLSKEKGVHCLISSIKMLIDEGLEVELNLYGSSTNIEFNYIKSLAIGYEKSIIFRGNVTQLELANGFNNSDLFILPSFYEGLGLVALEAIACGCRVIITDLPNLTSILPKEIFTNKIITKVPLPNILESIEIKDLRPFCLMLKKQIKEQITSDFSHLERQQISNFANDFTYKSFCNKLIGVSNELIKNEEK